MPPSSHQRLQLHQASCARSSHGVEINDAVTICSPASLTTPPAVMGQALILDLIWI